MAYASEYDGTDLANMGIDVGGAFLNGLVAQAGTLAVIIIAIIVIALIVDLLTGVFGIVNFIKGTSKKR
jgi:hypothetical protein